MTVRRVHIPPRSSDLQVRGGEKNQQEKTSCTSHSKTKICLQINHSSETQPCKAAATNSGQIDHSPHLSCDEEVTNYLS
jgi:hypothetical protein